MKTLVQTFKACLLALGFMLVAVSSQATIHVITVSNNVFTPSSLSFPLGDTVKWQWVAGTHTTTSLTIPTGAATWNSNISPNVPTFQYKPTVVGSYYYKCTYHYPSMVGSFTVTCPTFTPTITSSGAGNLPCYGSTVLLSVTNPQPGWTFQWRNGTANIPGATSSQYGATTSGSYTCIVTNSCGTAVSSNTVSLQFASQVVVYVSPTSATICQGTSQTIVATSNSGGIYSWSPSAGLNTTTGTTVIATPAVTTTYTCIITTTSGCQGYATSTITVGGAAPTAVIQANGNTTFCPGVGVTLICSSSSGVTYQWKKNGIAITGATSNSYTAGATGSYTCTVTNSCNISTTSNAISCTKLPAPQVAISPAGTVNICQGDTVHFVSTTSTGVAYQWLLNNGNIAGATSSTYNTMMAGHYKLKVTASNGCSSKSQTTIVNITCREVSDMTENFFAPTPNPTSTSFSLDIASNTHFILFDLTGKVISEIDLSEGTFSFGNDLDNGIYFVQLTSNNGDTKTYKVVKASE